LLGEEHRPPRIIYAGTASIRKGFHYLVEAWKKLDPKESAELHCYGGVTVPEQVTRDLPDSVVLYGRVSREEL
jgi:glycosyltransferase involved in cell wall biosynthesis